MSAATRVSWDEVCRMTVVDFLNTLCYLRDKREWEKSQMNEWRKKH